MASEWKQTSTVRTGGRIEVIVPELAPGEVVEVSVRREGGGTPRGENGSEPRRSPMIGSAKGLFRMSADFDEPLEEFEEYM